MVFDEGQINKKRKIDEGDNNTKKKQKHLQRETPYNDLLTY